MNENIITKVVNYEILRIKGEEGDLINDDKALVAAFNNQCINGTKYSRVDQVEFVEDSL